LLEQGVFLFGVNHGQVTSLFLIWVTNYFKTKVQCRLIDIVVLGRLADVAFMSSLLNVFVKLISCYFDVFDTYFLTI
jgi:hypothetical protein